LLNSPILASQLRRALLAEEHFIVFD